MGSPFVRTSCFGGIYREAKWITAEKRDSLVKLARWMGYIPYRKSGAIGILQVSADPTFSPSYTYTGKEVRVPRWAIFNDPDGKLNTYCTESVYYYSGFLGNLSVPVREGVPKQFLYIAQGVVNETIYIYSDATDNDEIEIQMVDAEGNFLYDVAIVPNLYLVNNVTDYCCAVENDPTYNSIKVIFGDGIHSIQLYAGQRVLIKYADTKGTLGDITSSNIITVIKTQLVDEENVNATLYCTNADAIVGGSEIETTEEIRNNAPTIFQLGALLSSIENWEALINSAPYVSKSIAWTVETLGGSLTVSDQNIVYITAISSVGEDLTAAQKTSLENDYILPRKCLTEVLSFEPLEKVYVRFDVTAKIATNKTIASMDSAIKVALNTKYDILNSNFQQNIYESNFYRIIDSVTDVIYHNTEIYYMERNVYMIVNNTVLLPSYLPSETPDLDKQNLLMYNTFEIWLKRKIGGTWIAPLQIAYSSGINIIGMNGYTITGGFVNYSTNEYSFNQVEIVADTTHAIYGIQNPGDSDDLGYIICITYKMQDGNYPAMQSNTIRLPRFYQITDIDLDFINTDLSYIA